MFCYSISYISTQLKSLAKTTEALDVITKSSKTNKELEAIGKSYTTETLKAALAQSTLNKEQIKVILSANGLQGELLETTADELANAASTNMVAASQKAATTSTLGFGTAIKGLGISIKKLAAAHPILTAISVAGAAIFGITKTIKHFTISLKDQQEITQNLQNELSELQSDISDINSRLQTTADRINELKAKDSLSFVEQEELENLIAQNDELERKNRLLAEQENKKRQETAESVHQEFDKKYGNQQYVRVIPEQEKKEMKQKRERWEELRINSGYNTEEEIAEMQRLRQELDEWDSVDSSFVDFSGYIQSVITSYEELKQKKKESNDLSEYEESLLAEYQDELFTYAVDLEDYIGRYGIDDETSQSWKDLSASIYKCLYPAEYLTEKFNEIFDNLPENVQSELKQMARDGSLSVDSLSDDIINKFSEAGFSATEVIEQIRSMLEDPGDPEIKEPVVPLSLTQTVEQLNSQLKPSLDALANAYQTVFSLNDETGEKLLSLQDIGIGTFASIKSSLDELNKIDGVNINYSVFDRFVSVLSDTSSTADEVQEQFDNLATSIIYTTDCTNMSAETYDLLVKSLAEMGITNAYEILEKIRGAQEELAELSYDAETATIEETKSLIELGIVTAETKEYLRHYLIQKELAQNPLSTLDDITKLEDLCNALGVTGQLYEYVTKLKHAFDAKERGDNRQELDESIGHLKDKIAELAEGNTDFRFNFSSTDTGRQSGSGSAAIEKDTAETFDWIEQAVENVEKEIKELDETANSAYSTFSQKNEALAQEIGKVSEEIDLQQKAYEEYMRKADSVGLPDHYKQLVQSGAVNIEDISDEKLKTLINEYQNWYDKALSVSDAVRELKTDMKDLYVSAYELQTGNLKNRLDRDSITQKQYLEGLKTAYEQFYANLGDFAEQYHEAVLDYLTEEKGYLNSIAGAAASLIDTEIDRIEEDSKAQEDLIQKQIDLLEEKKKPLQDELDALEDRAERENLILNLQKAQYELARAENQRTKLVYTSEKGMVYTADSATIRDAQKDVDDAKLEIQKQSIQDQIDALDDETSRYNDLIDQINNAADVQIDALEKIKNKWQEVTDGQEYAKNVSLLTGEFGVNAINKILTGNDDDLLMQWKNSYINTLADIDMESQGYIGDLTEQIALLYGVDLSPLQSQFVSVKDSVNGMTDSLGRAASAIGNGMNVPNYNADNADTKDNNASPANLTDSITGVGIAANQSLPNVTSNMDNIAETAANAALGVSSVTDAINNIPESKDVTISVHTVGIGSISGGASSEVTQIAYSGNAYAKGTRRAEKGLAIIGEEKPEAVVTNNHKVLLADTPALVNMAGGETVYNGDETERMIHALKNPPLLPNSLATDRTWQERMQRQTISDWYQNHVAGVNMNGYHMPGKYAGMISSAADSVTNNSPSYVLNGGVNVTCTGITSQDVAKQVGKEIEKTFFGMNTKAYQKANVTR